MFRRSRWQSAGCTSLRGDGAANPDTMAAQPPGTIPAGASMGLPRLVLLLALLCSTGPGASLVAAETEAASEPTDLLTAPPPRAEPPGAEALKAATASIKELYQAEYATAKTRTALVARLTDQALQTEDDAAMRYALLHEARELAIAASNVATVIELCERIAKAYRGPDAAEQQREVLPRLSGVPVVASLLKLLDVPTDAYASSVVGRWYANETQDWQRALPL